MDAFIYVLNAILMSTFVTSLFILLIDTLLKTKIRHYKEESNPILFITLLFLFVGFFAGIIWAPTLISAILVWGLFLIATNT